MGRQDEDGDGSRPIRWEDDAKHGVTGAELALTLFLSLPGCCFPRYTNIVDLSIDVYRLNNPSSPTKFSLSCPRCLRG